jgi:hypothetical protein
MGTPDRANAHARAREADPWDLQGSREAYFRRSSPRRRRREVRESRRHPRRDAHDKSPREIALLRESSRIAGLR